jgi:hypothetical protein
MTLAIVINLVLGVVLLGLLALRHRPDSETAATPEQAMLLFQRSFPDALGRATVTCDGNGALLDLGAGGLGLLIRSGRRWNARLLAAHELSSVRSRGEIIELRFRDFAWPRARLGFDADTCASWSARLEELLRHSERSSRRQVGHA